MERLALVSLGFAELLALAFTLLLVAMLWVLGQIHLRSTSESRALITDEGPDIHTQMPDFGGRTLDGEAIHTAQFRGKRLVVLLISAGCGPCEQVLRIIEQTRTGLSRAPEFLLVLEASMEETRKFKRRFHLRLPILVDPDAAIRTELGIERTPYGLMLDEEGVVRMKGVINNRGQLEGLIRRKGRFIGGLNWDAIHEPGAPASSAPAELAFAE